MYIKITIHLDQFDMKTYINSVKSIISKSDKESDLPFKLDFCMNIDDILTSMIQGIEATQNLQLYASNDIFLPIFNLYKNTLDKGIQLKCLEIMCLLSKEYFFNLFYIV